MREEPLAVLENGRVWSPKKIGYRRVSLQELGALDVQIGVGFGAFAQYRVESLPRYSACHCDRSVLEEYRIPRRRSERLVQSLRRPPLAVHLVLCESSP